MKHTKKTNRGKTQSIHSYLHNKTFLTPNLLQLAKVCFKNRADIAKAVSIFEAFVLAPEGKGLYGKLYIIHLKLVGL